MNSTEINVLLGKFFEGETSLAEEKQLSELFTSGDYPPEFESEAIIFQYSDWEVRERKRNPEFEKQLQEIIKSIPDPLRKRKIRRVSWLAAASVLLLAGLVFTFRQNYLSGAERAAILHNRIEFNKACLAMNMISCNLKCGNSKTKDLDELRKAPVSFDRNYE